MAKKKVPALKYVKVNNTLMNSAIKIYSTWKKLDGQIDAISTRGINFPGELSEIFACYALNYQWKKNGHGDAKDPQNNRIIEVKGSSTKRKDLSSFSPTEEFDELVFVKIDKDNDKAFIYKTGINSTALKAVKVNENETFGDQQKEKRRPRLSVESKIIDANGLKPAYELDILTKTIKKL